ncbi:MAG: DUF493 family protein [Sterolibacterium sp.]|jgi:putative lipoic acid-binding regulatory protein|nr:DUF493 family protein [Sterolibacterium sp.]MBP9800393.1 DUF493 family protein [Sterolibacterium sp.]
MTSDSLLEFPCDFPIKIMGARHDDYARTILDIVLRHFPEYDAQGMEMRPSAKGNYLALTCTVRALSQAQLDALYRELSGHPMVKVVL